MIETPTLELTKKGTLDDIITAVHQLSPHDKLILIRILADDLVTEDNVPLFIPPGVYNFDAPFEVHGLTDEMVKRFEALPQPLMPQNAN